jgi:hypothetical protein
MRLSIAVGSSLAVVLLLGGAFAAEGVKSGPQVGDGCGVFEPLHVTGSTAGTKGCLV